MRASHKENKRIKFKAYAEPCSVPRDPTIMEFDANGLYVKDFHQRGLSSKKEASYIAQWAENREKSAKKIQFKNFIYNFCTAEAARTAHRGIRANTCKPMPQCSQIWQVSAKYCTFLDFLAHCWALYQSCTCELRIYVLMTEFTSTRGKN